jgi:uncharacterized protein (UPF0276 family)
VSINPLSENPPHPLGVELRPNNRELVIRLFESQLITHCQISAPGTWTIKELGNLPSELPIYLHSNFLNTIGTNNWPVLRKIAKNLRRLKLKGVTEHFGTFTDESKRKHGVFFEDSAPKSSILNTSIENLERWRELVGIQLFIENIPVTKNAIKYLDALSECATRSQTSIALDLPHLLISTNASNLSIEWAIGKIRTLRPKQIHIGGLSLNEERIEDNHKIVSLWLVDLLEKYSIKSDLITIEQGPNTAPSYLEKAVSNIQSGKLGKTPSLKGVRKTRTPTEFSDDLAQESMRNLGVYAHLRTRRENALPKSPILRFGENYFPYVYPIASLIECSKSMPTGDAVEAISSTLSAASRFYSWYRPKENTKYIIEVSNRKNSIAIKYESEKLVRNIPSTFKLDFSLTTKNKDRVSLYFKQ